MKLKNKTLTLRQVIDFLYTNESIILECFRELAKSKELYEEVDTYTMLRDKLSLSFESPMEGVVCEQIVYDIIKSQNIVLPSRTYSKILHKKSEPQKGKTTEIDGVDAFKYALSKYLEGIKYDEDGYIKVNLFGRPINSTISGAEILSKLDKLLKYKTP